MRIIKSPLVAASVLILLSATVQTADAATGDNQFFVNDAASWQGVYAYPEFKCQGTRVLVQPGGSKSGTRSYITAAYSRLDVFNSRTGNSAYYNVNYWQCHNTGTSPLSATDAVSNNVIVYSNAR